MIAVLLALSLSSSPSSVPPALRGIDTLPARAVVDDLTTSSLLAVAGDDGADVVSRARAVRALGDADLARVDVDTMLVALSSTTSGELEVQVALARFERAARRRTGAMFARATLTSARPALRRIAAIMWWRVGGETARLALEVSARDDVDPVVRAACVARLRAWSRSGARRIDVLDQRPDGGPQSPARR